MKNTQRNIKKRAHRNAKRGHRNALHEAVPKTQQAWPAPAGDEFWRVFWFGV